MLFSEKDRITTARKLMLSFLLQQVMDKDYSILPKLYEMTKIDNRKLLDKAHTIRNIFKNPSDTIFSDMVYLIYDEAKEDTSILQIFYDLVKNLFPAKVKEYESMMGLYNAGDERKWKQYLNNTYKVKREKNLLHLYHLFIPLYFNDEEVIEELADEYTETITVIEYAFLLNDQNLGDGTYVFNTDEKIFESVMFEKYLNKRKAELAEYLSMLYKAKVTEKNLYEFIHDTLKSKSEERATPLSNDVDGIITGATANIIVEQNGGMTWYHSLTNDGKKGYIESFNYHPNIENLIRMYFKEYVKLEWRKYYAANEEGFSKVYLAKDCVPDNVQDTYINIMYMYNLDVMCKLFNNVKDDYYLNFSWEKIANQDLIARYNNIISDMEGNIRLLNSKLEAEKQSKKLLKEQFLNKEESNEQALKFELALSKLNKKIDGKDEEIISLKRKLESKEEYIQLLLNQDDADITRSVDVSLLQQKRYLFVGHTKDAFPELRKTFANSIFMESENTVINNIQVDGIVMLIKYMSHSMFYKINSSNLTKDIPLVRCNTKNINTIYNKMMTFFE